MQDIPIADIRSLVAHTERIVAILGHIVPETADLAHWGIQWRQKRLARQMADIKSKLRLVTTDVAGYIRAHRLDVVPLTLETTRRTDEIMYRCGRTPPHVVLAVHFRTDISNPVPTEQFLGQPAEWVARYIEPEQPNLVADVVKSLTDVTPGKPHVFTFQSSWFGGAWRIMEVVDRGPGHDSLVVVSYNPYY
jgi:hypothetical protein